MAVVTPLPIEPPPSPASSGFGGLDAHAPPPGDAGQGAAEAESEKGGLAASARRPAIIATLVAAALVAVALSDAGAELETTLARPIEFRVRALLGREPELAPSVKVFAFEDRSASASGYTDFPLDDWSRVLTAMAASKPRTILVDKTFAHPLGRRGLTTFTSRLAQEGIPLVAKAHVTGLELRHLEALPLDQFAKPHDGFIRSTRRPGMAPRKPLWMSSKVFHAYGPVHALLPAFHAIGHNAAVDHGHLAPVVNVAGNRSLLHWSLYAAASQGIVDGDLSLDGKLVPVDSEGRIPVNLVPFSRLLSRTRSLVSALEDAKSGNAVTGIEAGDTIVILPDMYTGVIDFEDTAIGRRI